MPTLVLATKLFIPPPQPKAVLRADLIARLNEGFHRKLTLISAPAGFGKTSLVSAWIVDCGRSAAWLSLDSADNDPAQFLAYFVAALQTIAPTVGADVIALLQSSKPPPIDALLPLLLNQVAMLPQRAILVLDDYHLLQAKPIDQALAFLVDHLPPQLHLVVTTRENPNLPLARYRARDQLTELRAVDLRFTPDEAAAFLTEVMGLRLSAHDIGVLEARTEGWIVGLQLAALSLQGRKDASSIIRTFTGGHRYILDYLVDEVLERQPKAVRNFLLQTAILDRLHGSLCDAVTGQEHSGALLEALHRGNFFVVPLDDQRQWYRYHHLFADVLAAQLMAEQPEQVAMLHQRASAWYERNGSTPDAIRHALTARDFARAADLIERTVPAMRRTRQERVLLGWFKALPDELISSRPVLSVHYAGALLSIGVLAGVETWLREAERWLDTPAAKVVMSDETPFRQLPGAIAVYRAAHALALGNAPETVVYAEQALNRTHEDDHVMRGAATALLGIANWTSGNLDAAYQLFARGLDQLRMAGNIADAIGGAIALADIRVTQGRLYEARRIYERGLQLAAEHGAPQMRGTADMYVGLSELARECGDLQVAMECLRRSQEQGEHTGFPQHPYRWRVALARVREAEGDLDGALDLLEEAERRYMGDFFPRVRPIAAWKARVWIAQGRLGDALGWAREQGLSAHDELSYRREFEHITLARVLLARSRHDPANGRLHEAIGLLDRLLEAAEAGERTGSVIEILVLLSLAHQMQGDLPAAVVPLSRALMLAEPEQYVRLFVDEDLDMVMLLERMKDEGGRKKPYIHSLLNAFGKQATVHPSSLGGGINQTDTLML